MISSSEPSWQEMLKSAHKSKLSTTPTEQSYKVQVPDYYASLIDPDDPNCPIRLQAIPNELEKDPVLSSFLKSKSLQIFGRSEPWKQDSIGDLQFLKSPRLTHRYQDRAILHLTATCAMYCRFCFRKAHLNDSDRQLYQGSISSAIDYIRSINDQQQTLGSELNTSSRAIKDDQKVTENRSSSIREVILTGGDPLSLSNAQLEKVLLELQSILTLRSIRIHTRMPVTLPQRIDQGLLDLLQKTSESRQDLQIQVVSHFNHPKEITQLAIKSLKALQKIGVPVYNQSVLLKRINDRSEVLFELFQTLYETGVRPYYIHHPDWTPNTFYFRTSIQQGQQIVANLRGKLSGPAMPTYVLDLPDGHGKQALMEANGTLIESFICSESKIEGAIYEFSGVHTRQGQHQKVRYLDLYT